MEHVCKPSLLSRLTIPHPQSPVTHAQDDARAVQRDCYGKGAALAYVSFKRLANLHPRRRIPKHDRAITGRRDYALAIG